MKIAAVIVTYNRLELLKNLLYVMKTIKEIDQIIVVNNNSTDGTSTWLKEQNGFRLIEQPNTGGSGGFYTGIKYAYESGYDWIWCMDDDVWPQENCLKNLLDEIPSHPNGGIFCPKRLMEGSFFSTESISLNMDTCIRSMHKGKIPINADKPLNIEGMVFEGPIISRDVIQKIGLPNKDLFIFYDDTDYSYRAVLANFEVIYIPQAIMNKKNLFSTDKSWTEKQRKKKWKRYYLIRNSAYFNHHYGNSFGVKYIRALNTLLGYIFIAFFTSFFSKAYKLNDILEFINAYKKGIREELQ